MQLQLPETVELKGIRVLTTRQLAQAYETTRQIISNNFNYNKHRYVEGKHYIALEGNELRAFKASHEIHDNLKYAHIAYLWTEKGALLHAKSLNTDKAWEVYDYLVDFYFRAKEEPTEKTALNPPTRQVVDVPENPQVLHAIQKIRDDLTGMDVLLQHCIRYTGEEEYKNTRRAAAEIVSIIIEDWNKFFAIQPKLIQHTY